MARGGYRPGAGRPVGTTKEVRVTPVSAKKQTAKVSTVIPSATQTSRKNPLEYMLDIVNDETVDQARRDRMAIAAAPFIHARPSDGGKKEEKQAAAKKATAGKFAPAAPPLRLVK